MSNGVGDKTAVVLFNLGGPDQPSAIRPFLFNLFSDPAIMDLPGPARWLLAQYVSRKRARVAKSIYAEIGGASPLLAETKSQADALEAELGEGVRVFICMRYWHPMSDETAQEVAAWQPDRIVLLPLYPQFSATTTDSSLNDWHRAAKAAGLSVPTSWICCYPQSDKYVAAQARLLRRELSNVEAPRRVLFSAHGLPKRNIEAGDPYQWQIERTAKAVADAAGLGTGQWFVCYQSQVGRLEWIGPSIDQALSRAAGNGVSVVVVPISFVSEHSETLVELDIEYRKMAEDFGVPGYHRVPTLSAASDYIDALAELVRDAAGSDGLKPPGFARRCPESFSQCACREAPGV